VIPDSHFNRFTTPKYRAKSPLKRKLIRRFVHRVEQLIAAAEPCESVLEVGCGEGFLLGHLAEKYPQKRFAGVDLSEHDVQLLRQHFPGIDARTGSAYDLSEFRGGRDLVICAEVLEHLDQPTLALTQIASVAPRRVILTVPHEPWFMLSNLLRGKNVTRLGDDIEHINHFTVRSFRRLLEPYFRVLELTTSYPWILSLNEPLERIS